MGQRDPEEIARLIRACREARARLNELDMTHPLDHADLEAWATLYQAMRRACDDYLSYARGERRGGSAP